MFIDMYPAVEIGIALLGQPDAQSIDELSKTTAALGVMVLVLDIQSAGEASQRIPPARR